MTRLATLTACALVLSLCAAGYADVELARDGRAVAVIVAPKGAAKPVRFAAEELRDHLNRMTGATFRIVETTPANGPAVILGDSPEARAAGIRAVSVAHDGYVIKTVGNRLLIVGRDDPSARADIRAKLNRFRGRVSGTALKNNIAPDVWAFDRGTACGVYRFLETLGVRWFFAGEKGTVVPRKASVTVPDTDLREEPVFKYRVVGSSRWFPRLMSKKLIDPREFRDMGWDAYQNRLWLLRQRGSSTILPLNHRPPRVGWVERFAKEHPEYFALLADGRRDLKAGDRRYRSHLCYSHPGMFRETILDIEAYADGKHARTRGIPKRYLERYQGNRGWSSNICWDNVCSVLPHDSFRACHCPLCKPLLRPNAPYAGRNSAQVWPFVKRVGEAMMKRRPKVRITCLAYSSYGEVPDNVASLPPNVIVGLCPGVLNKPMNLTDPKKYAALMDLIARWRKVTRGPLAYWFHHLYRHRRPQHDGVPVFIPHLTARLLRDLSRHGKWMLMQLDNDAPMFEAFNRYMMMRLLYNPNQDVDLMVRDYLTKFYGPAARVVGEVLADVEKRGTGAFRDSAGRIELWEKRFPIATLKTYRRKADRAVALTRGAPQADAARLFSKYYVGRMERGYARYQREVGRVVKSGAIDFTIRPATGPLKIDGVLDEAAWKAAGLLRGFHNNQDSEKTQLPTELRALYTPKTLYFAFTCFDPKALSVAGKATFMDSVEMFLDTNGDHDSFYQILVRSDGKVRDWYYENFSEKAQPAWDSRLRVGIKRYADRWVAEFALPRDAMDGGLVDNPGRPWGVNFCRSMANPPRADDRFSGASPLLRGAFKQPDLFLRMRFAPK